MSLFPLLILAFLAPEFTAIALFAYAVCETLAPRQFHEILDTLFEILQKFFSILQEVFEPVATSFLTILLRVVIIPDATTA